MKKAFVISEEGAREAAAKGRKEALQYCVRKYRWLAEFMTTDHMPGAEIYTDTCSLCYRYRGSPIKCPLIRKVCPEYAICHTKWRRISIIRCRGGTVTSFRQACRDFANTINRKLAPKDRI